MKQRMSKGLTITLDDMILATQPSLKQRMKKAIEALMEILNEELDEMDKT